jgi:hypothetical protein
MRIFASFGISSSSSLYIKNIFRSSQALLKIFSDNWCNYPGEKKVIFKNTSSLNAAATEPFFGLVMISIFSLLFSVDF